MYKVAVITMGIRPMMKKDIQDFALSVNSSQMLVIRLI